jgi:hypothetical protein
VSVPSSIFVIAPEFFATVVAAPTTPPAPPIPTVTVKVPLPEI